MAAGSDPGHLIHQPVARCRGRGEGPIQIGYPITDMVDAGPPLGEEPGDGALGVFRLEQFDFRRSERERYDPGSIGALDRSRGQAEDFSIESQGGFDILDRHADMSDLRAVGHGSAAEF